MAKHRSASGPAARTLAGVVRHHNFSPKGEIEGVVLDTDDGPAQVNFPHGSGSAPGGAMHEGEAVRLVVEPGHGPGEGDHPVYDFLTLTNGGTEKPAAPGPPRAEGVVARLNYARHGEPNGVVLDTGDFVHLKPHGMRLVALAVGDRVVAEGAARPTVTGHRVIEAAVVNGVAIAHGPHHH